MIWLIGEAPTRHTTEAFAGRSGNKMSEMAGFNVRRIFRCTNVLEEWPGKMNSKGAQFPLVDARKGVRRLLLDEELNPPTDRLLLVGGRVVKAFMMSRSIEPYRWTTMRQSSKFVIPRPILDMPIAYVPHPSGINQHWNDARNVVKFREFMQDCLTLV